MAAKSRQVPTKAPGAPSGKAQDRKLEGICYERSFLKSVVARLDVLSPLAGLENKLPPAVFSAIISRFPIPEKREVEGHHITLTKGKRPRTEKTRPVTEWLLHSSDRKRTVCISPSYVWIRDQAYTRYEDLREDFAQLLRVLDETSPRIQPSRLGLRYINVVDDKLRDWSEWKKLITAALVIDAGFLRDDDRTGFAGSLTTLEVTRASFRVGFRFGQFNPIAPSPSPQTQFVLDIDVYSDDVGEISDVATGLDRFHAEAQELFELSVTDELRKRMRPIKARLATEAE